MNLRVLLSASLRVAVGLSLLPLAMASAEAQVQSKYDRVLQNKKIIAGAQEGTPPFGYVDEKGELAGWAVDLSKALHALIEKKMETKLELEFRKVTPQTRIPLIVNGSLDWVLGSTGKTVEREQVVDFSLINNAVCVKTLHRKSMPVNAISDLGGKRIGVTNGSVEQKLLTEMGQTGKISPPAQLVVFPTHAVGFLALEQGRTDAHVTLDVALKSLAMRAQNPGEWAVSGPDLMCTPNGIILPQNDSKWKRTVDHALCYFIHTGGYTKLWDEWFGESYPKAGFALPISEQTKTVLYGQCPFGIEDWLKAK
ncbi:MAG: transporter substrate-binding domain-containing protein [Hyphomicrobiales bacterium]|nr:transporter substrate-binding domain-containing protein [Hyphomicrobiales bacterium]